MGYSLCFIAKSQCRQPSTHILIGGSAAEPMCGGKVDFRIELFQIIQALVHTAAAGGAEQIDRFALQVVAFQNGDAPFEASPLYRKANPRSNAYFLSSAMPFRYCCANSRKAIVAVVRTYSFFHASTVRCSIAGNNGINFNPS